jgi:hypothetical protein
MNPYTSQKNIKETTKKIPTNGNTDTLEEEQLGKDDLNMALHTPQILYQNILNQPSSPP